MKIKYNEIFSYNKDINKTAYMNWRLDSSDHIMNMNNIAEGYAMAAITLCERCLSDNARKEADVIIFPMLFSANHAIELYLKSIMWSINILLDRDEKFEKHHNICQIFNTVKNRILEYESEKENRNDLKLLIKNLELYLKELEATIQKENINKNDMDFSRYPLKNNLENHFYLERLDNVVVDLENFKNRFNEIFENLNTISGYYADLIDYKCSSGI